MCPRPCSDFSYSALHLVPQDVGKNENVSKLYYFKQLSPVCLFFSSRNAKAAPRTRHAQLLLPVPWRSRADHATTGLVSHRQTKQRACTDDSCKQGAITIPSLHIGCTLTLCAWRRSGGLQRQQPTQGRSASGSSCCAAAASATRQLCVPSTCQTHHSIRAAA